MKKLILMIASMVSVSAFANFQDFDEFSSRSLLEGTYSVPNQYLEKDGLDVNKGREIEKTLLGPALHAIQKKCTNLNTIDVIDVYFWQEDGKQAVRVQALCEKLEE